VIPTAAFPEDFPPLQERGSGKEVRGKRQSEFALRSPLTEMRKIHRNLNLLYHKLRRHLTLEVW